MRKTYLFFVVATLTVTMAWAADGPLGDSQMNFIKPPEFRGLSRDEGDRVVRGFDADFIALENSLMHQLQDPKASGEAKTYAVYLLGRIRSHRAIPILIKNIDMQASHMDPATARRRWSMYPAQEALVAIGYKAAEQVVAELENVDGAEKRKQLCEVMSAVMDPANAKMRVETQVQLTVDPQKKNRLELSLPYFR